MAQPYPKSSGFLLSFTSLAIPNGAGGREWGIREISLKNTMQGRGKVFGSGRRALGVTAGRPDWSASIKWNLDHFTDWITRNQPYQDIMFDLPFPYIESGLLYEVTLIGLHYMSEDHTATEGSDGGLEKTVEFGVIDVVQRVNGQEIQYRLKEEGES